MLTVVALATVWANMPLPKVKPVPRPRPVFRECLVPADLTPDPDVRFEALIDGVPADLPGPRLELPHALPAELGETVRAGGLDYTHLYVGTALVDIKTGGVTINGADFSTRPFDCP